MFLSAPDFARSEKNHSRRFSIFSVFTQPRPIGDILRRAKTASRFAVGCTVKYVANPRCEARRRSIAVAIRQNLRECVVLACLGAFLRFSRLRFPSSRAGADK